MATNNGTGREADDGRDAKLLIVNADDFGASEGINRAVSELYDLGIVTSASLMVTGRAAAAAAYVARLRPGLSVGLHWDVCGEGDLDFDLTNIAAVRRELTRQLDAFVEIVGRTPTHLDSHRHTHRSPGVFDVFLERGAELGIPVRDDGNVTYVGGFYAQWEWMVTDLEHVSVDALRSILAREIGTGWFELACHPGYTSPTFASIYDTERDAERETLADPAIREAVATLGMSLVSYGDWRRSHASAQRATKR